MRSTTFLFTCTLLAGCGKEGGAPPAPSGSASTAPAATVSVPPANSYGAPVGLPISVERVVSAVNPEHKPAYSGPTGRLRGKVTIDGDPAPATKLKFPERCQDSAAAYGQLFRVGAAEPSAGDAGTPRASRGSPPRALADVLVAVTGYGDRGWVPAQGDAVKVALHRCVPAKLTYAVTFGQRLEVSNIDKVDSYMPFLDGMPGLAIMVAIPGGAPVKLYPTARSPAHYMLRDQLDSGLVAQVFVLNYSTHDVTGLDGQYEIKNIPVGKVHVGALLPVIEKSDERDVEIQEGDNTLDLTLHFDAAKDLPKRTAPAATTGPAPSGAGPRASTAPAAAPKAPSPPR